MFTVIRVSEERGNGNIGNAKATAHELAEQRPDMSLSTYIVARGVVFALFVRSTLYAITPVAGDPVVAEAWHSCILPRTYCTGVLWGEVRLGLIGSQLK